MERLTQLSVVTVLTLLAGSGLAAAAETGARAVVGTAYHADVEVDPTAYALRGYSLHVGLGRDHLRLDLGAFAMALPSLVQGDEDFEVSFDGFGAKLQYFFADGQRGGFAGVDAGVARPLVERAGTDLAARDTQVSLGVNAGWRFDLGAGIYVTPWIGVSYAFSAEDVTLGGSTYENQRVTVFPAVHVGYRLR